MVKQEKQDVIAGQKFDLVESIRCAGLGTVTICAFVTCFGTVAGLIKEYLASSPIFPILTSVLEVTGASLYFSAEWLRLGSPLSLFDIGFALGFGGISVMLQSAVFLRGSDISIKKYIPIKLTEGLVSGLLTILFTV